MLSKRVLNLAIVLPLFAASPSAAWAAEGTIFGGPVGGTDIRNAYLPMEPGFYGSLVGAMGNATSMKGDNDITTNATEHYSIGEVAAGISYVYPFKILGATGSSFVQPNYQLGNLTANGKVQSVGAMGDTYAELLGLSWNLGHILGNGGNNETKKLPYGLSLKASYSMIFPVGYYSKYALVTPGHADFFFIPNFAATYLFGPNLLGDGLEASAHVFIDIGSTNPATDYKSGVVADLDFAITERTNVWQYGLAGYFTTQLSSDYIGNTMVAPTGKHLQGVGLGPVLAYDIPSLKATLKLKIYYPVTESNTTNTVRSFISIGFKL